MDKTVVFPVEFFGFKAVHIEHFYCPDAADGFMKYGEQAGERFKHALAPAADRLSDGRDNETEHREYDENRERQFHIDGE